MREEAMFGVGRQAFCPKFTVWPVKRHEFSQVRE